MWLDRFSQPHSADLHDSRPMATHRPSSGWAAGAKSNTIAPQRLYQTAPAEQPGQLVTVSEWGDVYPLTKSSIEDQLTPDSIASGLTLTAPGLRDEFALFPFAQFQQQRLMLLKRINEAAAQPQVRRTPRPLPALSVATKEQKEEFLSLLASVDTPLSSLLSTAPHGLKGAMLLDEMWSRAVNVQRAVWFVRIVYRNSVSDSARVRVSSQQRCRLWTDEVRRYMEQLVHDVTAAVRPAAARQQQTAGTSPFSQLVDKFHYMVVLVAVTYNEGLMARVRWLEWLVDQFLALATALLSLPSSYPPSTASSTLQAFAASFILWQHKATLLFLLLAPFQSSLQLSCYHSFRLFHCLTLIRQKLRGMVAANDEARLSKERALRRCEIVMEELTDAAVGGDMWEQWVSGADQPLSTNDDSVEGVTSAAELLVKLEDWVGKGEDGADEILRCLRTAVLFNTPLILQPMHVLLEWCTHPHFIHHTESVAAVFTLVCNLAADRTSADTMATHSPATHDTVTATTDSTSARSYAAFITPAAVSASPFRAYIASSLHSFLLVFPSLPAFSSAVCRHRLLSLLSHLVSVGLFDYPQYVHYLLRMDLLSLPAAAASPISNFSVDSLCSLPAPTSLSSSTAELRRAALYGLTSVKREEAALYWHSMCVLLQRAPVMTGDAARDVWYEKRRQCASKLQRLHVSLIRRLRGLHPYIVDAIDSDTAMLAPAQLGSFLSLLPFHVSLRLLSGLLDDLLSFVHSSLSATALRSSALGVYVERVVRYLLFLLECSPHFPLLFSSLFRLLSLSSDHRLHIADCVFSACRRHWLLLRCTAQSSALHSAMVQYLRSFDDAVSADICVEQCGLPQHFTNSVQAELTSHWQAKGNSAAPLTATLLPNTLRPTLSADNVAALLERYRTRQAGFSATLAAIRELSPTAKTLHAFQREIVRHVLILALTPPTAAVEPPSPPSLYAAQPHMQPSNVKLRLAELCCMLRAMAECHAELGRERTEATTSLLTQITLAAASCDELEASDGKERQAASKFVTAWRLNDVVSGEGSRWRNAEMSEKVTDCLSLFLLMAINRSCLRLGRCLTHFCTELFTQQGGGCLRRMTSLLFSSSGRRVRVWECDRRWMDGNIQADGEEVFRLLRVSVLAKASFSVHTASPAVDEVLNCVVSCRAFQRLCARHLPSFHLQLRMVLDPYYRIAVFAYIDRAVRSMGEDQIASDVHVDECGGMEGVSEAMMQELVRQDKSRQLTSDTATATRIREPLLPTAPVDIPSSLSLLSSLDLFSLPFLHVRVQVVLDAPSPSFDLDRKLLIATLLQSAELTASSKALRPSLSGVSPTPPSSADDAYVLLLLLCSTDAVVCHLLAESLTSQLAVISNDITSTLSSVRPPRDDDIAALLLQLISAESDVDQVAPSLLPVRAASLLSSLYCSPSFNAERINAFVHSVVQHVSSIASACNSHSTTLLSFQVATLCLDALDTLRQLLLPLLPHLGKPANSAVLDELLKSCLSLLVFPLSSLSASPDDRPFSSFLLFFARAAAQLQWAEGVQQTLPQANSSSAASTGGSGKAASNSARAESVLFELHSSLLASSRQRPIDPLFLDRLLQCIPSSQGGAVADELHYMLPPSIAPPAVTSSSTSTSSAATRQPIDPWCVLEGCGGGPLVDAVWDSSLALPRV